MKKRVYSKLLIIIANLVPIMGMILFNWDLYVILVGYWSELLIASIFDILKRKYFLKKIKNKKEIKENKDSIFVMGAVYFFMLISIFGFLGSMANFPFEFKDVFGDNIIKILSMFGAFVISHSVSFFSDFRNEVKLKDKKVSELSLVVSARKIVSKLFFMMILMIFSYLIIELLKIPKFFFIIFIIMKTTLELNIFFKIK
jgi:hypothetical protein